MAFLVVGLGNPGKQYEKTRHNVGFMTLDAFLQKNELSDFRFDKKSNSLVSEGVMNGKKILLAKPQTFMNTSGLAVKSLTTYYSLPTTTYLIVVHDDIDIPLGKVKVSVGRGPAGHKGVESIINALGTKDFTRVRIGIQPISGKPENVESFVLRKFTKQEQKTLEFVFENACAALETILKTESK